jgi:hydroquinone glucosyltransferase
MEKLGLGLYFEEKDANCDSRAHDPAQDYHWPC